LQKERLAREKAEKEKNEQVGRLGGLQEKEERDSARGSLEEKTRELEKSRQAADVSI
jgi:hypothetical protein